MTVGFMRWLQRNTVQGGSGIAATTGNNVIAPPLCKQFAPFRGELATTALRVDTNKIIIEPTSCARCRVRLC